MHSIVLFGRDPYLLNVRRLLLEREHFHVVAVHHASELATVDAPVELLVFCHTASKQYCETALQTASVRWPSARRLFLIRPMLAVAWMPEDESLSTFDGPAKLISRVRQLVQPQPAPLLALR